VTKEYVHNADVFPLDKNEGTIFNLLTPSKLQKELRKTLIRISQITHCQGCGGLLPEVAFTFEGKKYRFTCYRIDDEDGKKIVGTDYEKFCKFHASS